MFELIMRSGSGVALDREFAGNLWVVLNQFRVNCASKSCVNWTQFYSTWSQSLKKSARSNSKWNATTTRNVRLFRACRRSF